MVESTAAIVTMRGGGMRCEGAGAAVGATTGRGPDITSDGLDVKQKGGVGGRGGGRSVGVVSVCSPLSHRNPIQKLLLIDNPTRTRSSFYANLLCRKRRQKNTAEKPQRDSFFKTYKQLKDES